MCSNSLSSSLHYGAWNQFLVMQEGSPREGRNNLQLSLQSWKTSVCTREHEKCPCLLQPQPPCHKSWGKGCVRVWRRLEASAWASRGAEPQLAEKLKPRRRVCSSIRVMLSQIIKPWDVAVRKGAAEVQWESGPINAIREAADGYKVRTLKLLVNVKTFSLKTMAPYATALTLFGTIGSDNDGH